MNSKIVEDGKFKVYENGLIEKLKKGVYIPATMTETRVGRDQSQYEMVVTYCGYGEQTQYYAKRLIADAFVPSLNNSGFIDYSDGNYENLSADNLYRKTQKEVVVQIFKTRAENAPKCKGCGEKTMATKGFCKDCIVKNKTNKRLDWIEGKKIKRSIEAMKELNNIDLDSLKSTEKAYVERKMKGYTLEEIGKEFGKSRERIRQVLAEVKERNV